MKLERSIGIHIRIQETLSEVMFVAQQLNLEIFQSFISIKNSGKRLFVDKGHVQKFVSEKHNFDEIFFHGSYKINPSSCVISYHYVLEHEIQLTIELGIPNLILHPGSASNCKNADEAIDALARTLNSMQKKYPSITFILENGAHGNVSIGCDIQDFSKLLVKLNYPERIQFCIDTAHAFCYGYDIKEEKKREDFIQLLEAEIGIQRIRLLHINDTKEQLGSNRDEHAILGEGTIGLQALQAFVLHPKLIHIPIILELPALSLKKYRDILEIVRAWHL